jgi:hypothetical protein
MRLTCDITVELDRFFGLAPFSNYKRCVKPWARKTEFGGNSSAELRDHVAATLACEKAGDRCRRKHSLKW